MTQQVKHFIDGEFVAPTGDKLIAVTNPATQDVIAQVACATQAEMERAIESAKAAFLTWKEVPVSERARLMMRFAHLLKEHQGEIADIICRELGKTVEDAKGDVWRGIEVVEQAANIPSLMMGETLGDDGKRLSKRHGAVGVMQYRDNGFLPEALLNYLVRLGWSHGDQEIFSKDELVQLFDLDSCNRAPSAFNTDKLIWLNQHYMKTLPPEQVAKQLEWHIAAQQLDISKGPVLTELVKAQAERVKTLKELVEVSRYFYEEFAEFDAEAAKKHLRPVALEPLQAVQANLAALADWSQEAVHQVINATAEQLGVGMGKIGMPLRVAVTGGGNSPALDITLALIGKQRTLARLKRAIDFVVARAAE